jgi:hypothetical protein
MHSEQTQYATFIQKLDANGNFVWGLSTPKASLTGSYSCLELDPAGYLFNAEVFSDTIDVDPGPAVQQMIAVGAKDVHVQKFDTAGNLLWAKQFSSQNTVDRVYLAYDGNGGVWAYMRYFDSLDVDPGPAIDLLYPEGSFINNALLHLDANGNVLSVAQTSFLNYCNVHVGANGDLLITADISDTVDVDPGPGVAQIWPDDDDALIVVQLDDQGDFVWAKKVDYYDVSYINWASADAAGNVYVLGYFMDTLDMDPGPGVTTITPIGQGDTFIWKLDPMGNLISVHSFGGTDNDEAFVLELGANGDVYIVGFFEGTMDVDPGPGIQNISSQGSYDGFFVRLSATGQYISSGTIGGVGSDFLATIRLDAQENVYIVGSFRETADIDPGSGTSNVSAFGQRDGLVMRLNGSTVGLTEPEAVSPRIYPNPSRGTVFLNAHRGSDALRITDVNGRTVHYARHISNGPLDLGHLPAGTYIVQFSADGFPTSQQRVVLR